jgi:hypothetical protein
MARFAPSGHDARVLSPRHRPVVWGLIALGLGWALALGGYLMTKGARVTADRVRVYAESVDLARLQGAARAEAIRRLAAMLNALGPEERRRARLDAVWRGWFEQMSEEERAGFLDDTMPSGIRQMLTAFEQMAEEQRRRLVEDALKRLREVREAVVQGEQRAGDELGTNAVTLSPELQERIIKAGLRAYYTESSARTKAELAPFLEELQAVMQRGGRFRGPRH